jgi:hypothetical protein
MLKRPAMKRDGHREPGEDEVGRIKECVADAFRVTERPQIRTFTASIGLSPISDHHKTGDQKCSRKIDQNGIRP